MISSIEKPKNSWRRVFLSFALSAIMGLNLVLTSPSALANPVCTYPNFDGCDLSSMTFESMDLSGATFRGTNLTGANFRHTKLDGAKFGSKDLSVTMLNSTSFESNSLSGAVFENVQLSGGQERRQYRRPESPERLVFSNRLFRGPGRGSFLREFERNQIKSNRSNEHQL